MQGQWASTSRQRMPESWRIKLAIEQAHCCAGCWKPLRSQPWCLDHIVPVHKGGITCITNVQVLCAYCHGSKTSQEGSK